LQQPDAFSMTFDGAVLQRGFWLYVWRITTDVGDVFYVGRTGDSSSPNAASPFQRIGAHLDTRPTAKGNALAKQLRASGYTAHACRYEMTAVGPLFPEQRDMASHTPIRDKLSALERRLADHLRARGFKVLGTHGATRDCIPELWERVQRAVDAKYPPPTNRSLERSHGR
jgi:hypothetical protein